MAVLLLLSIFSSIGITNANKFEHESSRIINGEPASADEYPWMVSFRNSYVSYDIDFAFCGGTLIELDPPIIITAGHCFEKYIDYQQTDDTPILDSNGIEIEIYADIIIIFITKVCWCLASWQLYVKIGGV